SFSLVKSTSNLRVSSLPSQRKPRRNCSLSAPPLSQLASSDEVMYTRLPSQLCEIMLTCLPVTFSYVCFGASGLLRSKYRVVPRSEERRVGKECRLRGCPGV